MKRRIMKLRTPFSVIPNPLRDIDHIKDVSYTLPKESFRDFWEEECKLHPTKSTCKLYEVQTNYFAVIQAICIGKSSM